MGKIFNSIGHFFAWVFDVGLPKATQVVQTVEQDVASPLAAAIAQQLGGTKGTEVQQGIQAIAGDVLKAFGDAGAAIGAQGLNVQFDIVTIQAIEAIYGDLKSLFGKTAPVPAAVQKAS